MFRIGMGYDIHPFQQGRKLIIGGVNIQFEKGLAGHSDADVLLHAISDAILGALALGDIGHHFPDNDAAFKDINSSILLKKVLEMMVSNMYEIINLDTLLILEKPRITPYNNLIRDNIALLLGIKQNMVNVKATTHEKMGPVGRGEGIAAQAVVLLKKKNV